MIQKVWDEYDTQRIERSVSPAKSRGGQRSPSPDSKFFGGSQNSSPLRAFSALTTKKSDMRIRSSLEEGISERVEEDDDEKQLIIPQSI